jgi:hypothetical protein
MASISGSSDALSRRARHDLTALDEVGYVPLAELGAEFLFQVIAERDDIFAETVCLTSPGSALSSVGR